MSHGPREAPRVVRGGHHLTIAVAAAVEAQGDGASIDRVTRCRDGCPVASAPLANSEEFLGVPVLAEWVLRPEQELEEAFWEMSICAAGTAFLASAKPSIRVGLSPAEAGVRGARSG